MVVELSVKDTKPVTTVQVCIATKKKHVFDRKKNICSHMCGDQKRNFKQKPVFFPSLTKLLLCPNLTRASAKYFQMIK